MLMNANEYLETVELVKQEMIMYNKLRKLKTA